MKVSWSQQTGHRSSVPSSKSKKSEEHRHCMAKIEGGHVDDRVGAVAGPDSVNRRVTGPGTEHGLVRLKWAMRKRGFSVVIDLVD